MDGSGNVAQERPSSGPHPDGVRERTGGSRHGNASADGDVVKGPPPLDGEEGMVAGDLDGTAGSCRHPEARLDTAVHPGVDVLWLNGSIPRKAENGRHTA